MPRPSRPSRPSEAEGPLIWAKELGADDRIEMPCVPRPCGSHGLPKSTLDNATAGDLEQEHEPKRKHHKMSEEEEERWEVTTIESTIESMTESTERGKSVLNYCTEIQLYIRYYHPNLVSTPVCHRHIQVLDWEEDPHCQARGQE